MNCVFRVDSSLEIGGGHMMRCLTLADMLSSKGHAVSFICRDLPHNLGHLASKKGYQVFYLAVTTNSIEEDAERTSNIIKEFVGFPDWLIIDHYELDYRWQGCLVDDVRKIMVIDDLANRKHYCHLLLDQNLYPNLNTRYDDLTPANCKLLLGPAYTLLRNEFIEERKNLRNRDGIINRILVFFGGSDPTEETEKVIRAIDIPEFSKIAFDVIVGGANPRKNNIELLCRPRKNISLYYQVSNISQLMNNADLAIGAGGTATWERCFLGLPALVIILADNQAEVVKSVHERGAIINLGWYDHVNSKLIIDSIQELISSPAKITQMEQSALEIFSSLPQEDCHPVLSALMEE